MRKALEDATADGPFVRKVSGKQKGWSLNALAVALHFGMRSASFREGVDAVIRLGGDTDTNGAIAGAVLGAVFGERRMLSDDITRKNVNRILNCKPSIEAGAARSTRKTTPRPASLHPKHMLELLDELLEEKQDLSGSPAKKRRRKT